MILMHLDLTGLAWSIFTLVAGAAGLIHLALLLLVNAFWPKKELPFRQRLLFKYLKTTIPTIALGLLFWLPMIDSRAFNQILDELIFYFFPFTFVISLAWTIAIYRRNN